MWAPRPCRDGEWDGGKRTHRMIMIGRGSCGTAVSREGALLFRSATTVNIDDTHGNRSIRVSPSAFFFFFLRLSEYIRGRMDGWTDGSRLSLREVDSTPYRRETDRQKWTEVGGSLALRLE